MVVRKADPGRHIALIVLIALPFLPTPLFTSFLIYIALCIGILWAAALATALAGRLGAAPSHSTAHRHRAQTPRTDHYRQRIRSSKLHVDATIYARR